MAATRFVLSMIVFFGHMEIDWVKDYGELAAVVGFFIISGFSIGNSITQRPQRYIIRRIWRIWPTYLFSFFCCTLPVAYFAVERHFKYFNGEQPITWQMVLGNLFMLQGLLVVVLEANAPIWTLALEEWYYLFAPVFRRCKSWMLAFLILASVTLYVHARELGWVRFAGKTGGISHACFLWAWLIGFFFYRHRNSVRAQMALLLLPVWALKWNELGGARAPFTLLASGLVIVFGGKILSYAQRLPEVIVELEYKRGKVAAIKWIHVRQFLVFLGNVSYPLYIIHMPILYVFKIVGYDNWILLEIVTVFAASTLVYYFIDKPNRGRWQSKAERTAAAKKEKAAEEFSAATSAP